MKKDRIKTSKGEFILVDRVPENYAKMSDFFGKPKEHQFGMTLKPICYLRELTEETYFEVFDELNGSFSDFIKICSTDDLKQIYIYEKIK